jgi:hypothetical protein
MTFEEYARTHYLSYAYDDIRSAADAWDYQQKFINLLITDLNSALKDKDFFCAEALLAMEDTARMNYLESKVVNVREPLRYGSKDKFWASPEDQDGDSPIPSDLRQQIDEWMGE